MILIIVISILSIDQLSKFLATHYLVYDQTVPVLKGIFHLSLVHNRGAAFGILKNQVPLFILTSLAAIYLIYTQLKENKGNKAYTVYLSLILSGALGNLIDRIFFGYVVDFLDFRIWPVFNIADSSITIGAVLLGWSIFRAKK